MVTFGRNFARQESTEAVAATLNARKRRNAIRQFMPEYSRLRAVLDASQAHGLRAELRDEGTEEVDTEDVPPEALLDQCRIDVLGHGCMKFRSLAPMRTCFVVVNSVISVVKEEEIQPACEVSGVVPLRFFVGMHVLYVVKDKYGEQSNLLRDNDVEKRLLPVQHQERTDPNEQHQVLSGSQSPLATVTIPHVAEIVADRLLLEVGAHRWVEQQHQKRVILGQSIRDRVVAFLVIQAMVIHVVCWDPRKCREAIEHRKPIVCKGVKEWLAEDRQVIVIVSDHRYGNGKEKVTNVEKWLETDEGPLKDEDERGNSHVGHRASVFFESEQHRGSVFDESGRPRTTN